MTNEGDWVFDPFLGTGTSIIAAIKHNRKGAGAEISDKYIKIAEERIHNQLRGELQTRPMNQPIYDPNLAGNSLRLSPWNSNKHYGSFGKK